MENDQSINFANKRQFSMSEEILLKFLKHRPGLMVLFISLWFGLATGLGEGFLKSAKKFLGNQDRILFYNPDVTWMIPLSHVIIFSIIGFLIVIIAKFWPRLLNLRLVIGIFLFLGFLTVMLQIPRLDIRAILILALGLAFQISRGGEKYLERYSRVMIRTTGLLILMIALLSVVAHGILV